MLAMPFGNSSSGRPAGHVNTLNDLFDMPVDHINQQWINRMMLESSFFLPADVLAHPDFRVSPIFVLENFDFAKMYDQLAEDSSIHIDCNYALLAHAKNVGVSLRLDKTTGKRFTVFKLWYGPNPHASAATESGGKYAAKLANLHRFLTNDWK